MRSPAKLGTADMPILQRLLWYFLVAVAGSTWAAVAHAATESAELIKLGEYLAKDGGD